MGSRRVGLICTTQVDLGIRAISGHLQSRGIETLCFFLDSIEETYPDAVLAAVAEALRGAALVGISVIEMGKKRAARLSAYLREALAVKVVWGGTYPTLAPLEALEHADFVCVGEGDDTMPELLAALERRSSPSEVPNLVYRAESGVLERTPAARLKAQLDDLPFPDYFTPGKHYHISSAGRLEPMRDAFPRMERATLRFERNLWMMFGRGCHLKCTFCSVPALGESSRGLGKFFRFKSPERMISEIEWALRRTRGADYVYIMDNDFCAMPLRLLSEFCALYRDRIRLPFFCYGTPGTITREKVGALLSAGIERLDFGIQSGSDRVLALYERRATKATILAAAGAIAAAMQEATRRPPTDGYPSWHLKPYFDVMFNGPFEDREDLEETIDVIKRIGRMGFDFGLYCQPVTLFENTALHEQAAKGALGVQIDLRAEEDLAALSYQQIAEHILARGNHLYLNTLIYLMRYDHTRSWAGAIPRSALDALTSRRAIVLFERLERKATFRAIAKALIYLLPTKDRRYFAARHLTTKWRRARLSFPSSRGQHDACC